MAQYSVHYSDQVHEELWNIASWYAKESGSIEIGLEWHRGFEKVLSTLDENPERFSLARESDRFPYEVREILYGSGKRKTHRALFRITGNRVEVIFVRHHAQRDVTPDDIL